MGLGSRYNGLTDGEISALVNWNQGFALEVSNIDTTQGGADLDEDEHYRDRVWLAPESFSTCGPVGAYEFWAKSAHPDIMDVMVYSGPEIAGEVHLFPLMYNGELPSDEVLQAVYDTCNFEKRRPLTDYVFVMRPEVVNYEVELTYWIWRHDQLQAENIINRVVAAVHQWALWTRSAVGRDVIPSQLIRLVQEAGVKRVEVEKPVFTRLRYNEVAIMYATPILHFGGLEDHEFVP
jgi:phage-related baseplate assembly protein